MATQSMSGLFHSPFFHHRYICVYMYVVVFVFACIYADTHGHIEKETGKIYNIRMLTMNCGIMDNFCFLYH